MEQLFEEILSFTSDGIIVANKEFLVMHLNNAAINYLKVITQNKTNKYINISLFDILPQINLFHEKEFVKIYRNKKFQICFDDIHLALEIVINSSIINETVRHIITLRNVTDKIIFDIKNKKSQDNFIAFLSHELRNPLQSVTLSTYLLQNSLGNINIPEKSKTHLNTISKACGDMKRIINDILDLSKIDANELQLEYDNYSIENILNNLLNLFSESAQDKNINLTYKLLDKIPKYIFSDEVRINQILSNLISNAIKYTSNGDVIIEVSYNETNHEIIFKVIDSGVGINQNEITQLFKQFGKTSNSFKFNIKSNGLGLYLSQKLANLLGGYISVKSEPQKGSIFSFYHPIKLGNSSNFINDSIIKKNLSGNILLVDDNESNLILLSMLLESFGYEHSYNLKIESVLDGKDAIDICKANDNNYDIIFMDVNMNGIDGCTASKIIKNNSFKGKIIAVTGNIMAKKENRNNNNYDYFDEIIIKPFDDTKILYILNKYLE